MKTASIHQLKQELINESPAKLTEICLKLARFKKENKELLTYLLFEKDDPDYYMQTVRSEMEQQFSDLYFRPIYVVKKSLRKILRSTLKYIRYAQSDMIEAELLIHFCLLMKKLDSNIKAYPVIENMYNSQVKKIRKAIGKMEEDLQRDYVKKMEESGM